MSLVVSSIAFRDFRSYRSLDLDGIGPLTVFVGPNAAGKTNIVEGIQLLTALSSFRHATAEQLVRNGAASARLVAHVGDGSRSLEIALGIENGAKRYTLNGKPKRTPDLKGLVPAVTFTPDDLDLVKGAMGTRRAALDALGSQLSANHGVIRRDYERVIRYKNRLLKDDAPDDLLESINETLVTCGAQLVCYRAALFAKLVPELQERYARLAAPPAAPGVPAGAAPAPARAASEERDGEADRPLARSNAHAAVGGAGEAPVLPTTRAGGECLRACYVPSWVRATGPDAHVEPLARDDARAALSAALAERRADERQRRRALVGPHADRVEFLIDGADAALFGSQGQQRSIVLAFKLAEAAVIEEVLRQKPVLLLDDVMSELDVRRRAALMDYMADDVQTFITTTNLAYFEDDVLRRARVVEVPFGKGAA